MYKSIHGSLMFKKGGREGGKENSENGNKFISWDKGKTMVPLYLKS